MRKPRITISSTWFVIVASVVLGALVVAFVMVMQSLQATPSVPSPPAPQM